MCVGPSKPRAIFDTPAPVPHPREVLSFGQRLSAVLLALALAAGQAGVCAGWMPTADARMACCSDRVLTQAEADRCCAASEQDDSAPSPTNVAFFVTPAVALGPVPALLPEFEPHPDIWRAAVPVPATHVPKHLLLSVFLV